MGCCYDLRFPELFRLQHKDGVETFILPAAFTEQTGRVHWETLVKARAIENLCYLVTSCQDGYHISGRQTHGNTMIVNPWGQVLKRIQSGNGFVESEINRKQAKYIGKFFKKNKIKIDKVLSSEWCRCKETAKIAFRDFTTNSFLNSFYSSEFVMNKDKQVEALNKYIANFESKRNLILVTHYVLISEVLNYGPSSGEIVVSDKNFNIIETIEVNY